MLLILNKPVCKQVYYWSNKRMEGKLTKNEVCVISHSNEVPYRIISGAGHMQRLYKLLLGNQLLVIFDAVCTVTQKYDHFFLTRKSKFFILSLYLWHIYFSRNFAETNCDQHLALFCRGRLSNQSEFWLVDMVSIGNH